MDSECIPESHYILVKLNIGSLGTGHAEKLESIDSMPDNKCILARIKNQKLANVHAS